MRTRGRRHIVATLAIAAIIPAVQGCGDGRAPGEAPDGAAPDRAATEAAAPGAGPAVRPDTTGSSPSPADVPSPDTTTEVRVWFTRGEEPAAVVREVPRAGPRAALEALLRGPTAAERAAGLHSWFSDSTAGALRGVELRDGLLVVDFRGLDRLIPNASTSFGSTLLLSALDSTVLQFPEVRSVEYRLDGSCDAFGEWLQRGCPGVRRP